MAADFLVSPHVSKDIAKVCNTRKIPYLPGCGSVTEISKAEKLGVEKFLSIEKNVKTALEFIRRAKEELKHV